MRAWLTRWRTPLGALLGLALWGVLFFNAAWRRSAWDLTNLGHSRRYWEALTVATIKYQQGTSLSLSGREWDWQAVHVAQKLYALVPKAAQHLGIRSWEFWRRVPLRRFEGVGDIRLRNDEDVGRAWLSSLGFALLGGIAPYLPLWVGVLVSLPVFIWTSAECAAAGRWWVGTVVLALCAGSAYVAEQLTLPYNAAGFHVAGLLIVVPLAVHGLFTPRLGWLGVLGRWALAGALLGVCALSRGTVRGFFPAVVVLAGAAAVRLARRYSRRRAWVCAAAAALMLSLLVGPYLAMRPPFAHNTWMSVWEGLGDFDRSKGFAWDDPTARRALRSAGYVFEGTIQPGSNPAQEAIYRRLVLQAARSAPAWYLGILARRVPATLLQWKLWPRESVDGRSFAPSVYVNEGDTDLYYRHTRTADWYGVGKYWGEAPLPLLWLPLLLFAAAYAWRTSRGLMGWRPAAIMVVLVLAALATPLAVSTASGPEMQAFVLVYWLAAGFVVDGLARWRRARRAVDLDA